LYGAPEVEVACPYYRLRLLLFAMGIGRSSLNSKIVPHRSLQPFTAWGAEEVHRMLSFHANELGSAFALGPEQFFLLTLRAAGSRALSKTAFSDVFDTDRNNLVDAYEALIAMAVLSRMGLEETVGFAFNLFDYNQSHTLSADECTMLLHTFVGACCKMDAEKKLLAQPVSAFEALAQAAWTRAGKDEDGEISKAELLAFADNTPLATEFLTFIDGGASRVQLKKGAALWTDPDFPPSAGSLFLDPSRPPRGGLRPAQVVWYRPRQLAPDAPVLFVDEQRGVAGGGGAGVGVADPANAGVAVQGFVADRWLVGAMLLLSARPRLLRHVFVATGQEAMGRYCVRLCRDGMWVNVYVDDSLPCTALGRPLCSHSANPNEVGLALIEKAFAKLLKGWDALGATSCPSESGAEAGAAAGAAEGKRRRRQQRSAGGGEGDLAAPGLTVAGALRALTGGAATTVALDGEHGATEAARRLAYGHNLNMRDPFPAQAAAEAADSDAAAKGKGKGKDEGKNGEAEAGAGEGSAARAVAAHGGVQQQKALRSAERDPRGGADALWVVLQLCRKHGVVGCSRQRRPGALGGRLVGRARGAPRAVGGRLGGGGGAVAAGGGGCLAADATEGAGEGAGEGDGEGAGEGDAALEESAWFKLRAEQAAAAAAAARANDEDEPSASDDGLLLGRAYNIEELREVTVGAAAAADGAQQQPTTMRFVRLRCRWAEPVLEPGVGSGGPVGQWRGRWHAGDERWVRSADVAKALLPADTKAYKNVLAASGASGDDATGAGSTLAPVSHGVEQGNGNYALGGGVFWMEYSDWLRAFSDVHSCRVFDDNGGPKCTLRRAVARFPARGGGPPGAVLGVDGRLAPANAPGAVGTSSANWRANPQFAIQLEHKSDVFIELHQNPWPEEEGGEGCARRVARRGVDGRHPFPPPSQYRALGFALVAHEFGSQAAPVKLANMRMAYVQGATRELAHAPCVHHVARELAPGKYVVVPFGARPDAGGELVLTVQVGAVAAIAAAAAAAAAAPPLDSGSPCRVFSRRSYAPPLACSVLRCCSSAPLLSGKS